MKKRKSSFGNIFVDKFVEDDDQLKWGVIVDVLTNRSFSEFPGEPFFKYYNPKKYSRRKPTSVRTNKLLMSSYMLRPTSSWLARNSYRRALTMSGEKKLNSVAGRRLLLRF